MNDVDNARKTVHVDIQFWQFAWYSNNLINNEVIQAENILMFVNNFVGSVVNGNKTKIHLLQFLKEWMGGQK